MNNRVSWEIAVQLYKESFLEASKLSLKTRRDYIGAIMDLNTYALEQKIKNPGQITGIHLRRYIDQLDELPRSYRNRKKVALHSFYSFLLQQGLTEFDPSLDLRVPRNSMKRADLFEDFGSNIQISTQHEPAVQSTIQQEQEAQESEPKLITAQDIKAHLDTKVVGQESAKVQISVLLSMHINWFKNESRMHRAPNAIVLGPTGVGKTHTLRIASEYLKIPFISVDTTSLVAAGIAGYQIEDVLADLVREADEILKKQGHPRDDDDDNDNRDIDLARRGLIFFDEFDKITSTSDSSYTEASNLTVQRRLLKLTDGGILGVGIRTHQGFEKPSRSMDTSGILIVTGGAFVGIDDNRIRSRRPAMLQRDLAKSNPNIIVSADIVNFGFMPELVARLPVIIEYQPLTNADLLRILEIKEISPIQVWVDHFSRMGIELIIADDAKEYVVQRAMILKMGARGLHQIMFQSLAKIAFEVETSQLTTYVVTAEKISQPSQNPIGGKNDNQ